MLAQPPRKRTPPALWRMVRALYLSDPTLSLERVAQRFGVTVAATRRRCARERWRAQEPGAASGRGYSSAPSQVAVADVSIVSRDDFRLALRNEAVEWLSILRRVRIGSGNDPLGAIRQAAPLLLRLGRMEAAFDDPRDDRDRKRQKMQMDVWLWRAEIPEPIGEEDNGAD